MWCNSSISLRIVAGTILLWAQVGVATATPCLDTLKPISQYASYAQLTKALPVPGQAAFVFLVKSESSFKWRNDVPNMLPIWPEQLVKVSKDIDFPQLSQAIAKAGIKGSSIYPTQSEKNIIYKYLNIDTEERIKQNSFFINRPSIESVGSNTDYKGKSPLPAMLPHVVDSKGCVKPLQVNETPSIGETLTVTFSYAGFSEVAMLVKANSQTKEYAKQCSAVIIGKGYALTARHCFESLTGNTNAEAAGYALLVGPKSDGDSIAKCSAADTNAQCPYQVLTIGQPKYPTLTWVSNPLNSTPSYFFAPDVALIPITDSRAAGVIKRVASIRTTPFLGTTFNGEDTSGWLTVMGYGLSNVAMANEISGGYWMSSEAPKTSEDKNFSVLTQKANIRYVTRFCAGDSGGPVFLGSYTGSKYENTPRVVGALMHGGSGNASRSTCETSPKSAVQLLTDEIKQWICTQSKEIAGCS